MESLALIVDIFLEDDEPICGEFPDVKDINVESSYWQVLETSNGTIKMFNAFLDDRLRVPAIKIVAFINRVDPKVETHCQLWYDKMTLPAISKVKEYKLLWSEAWEVNKIGSQPYLISCPNLLHESGLVPTYVSLVEGKCDKANNNFKIIQKPANGRKKHFAVCTKDLDFPHDQSLQIVEWIEALSLIGADKIFIYVVNIHSNMMKTLRYYENRGKVEVIRISEPEGLPNRTQSLTQWLQNEMISLTDCFYRNMNLYEYLTPLDIDEIIVPRHANDSSWSDLMARTKAKCSRSKHFPHATYLARNVFFLLDNDHENETVPEVPKEMMFLQHIHRAKNYSGKDVGPKAFHDTNQVLIMHNHWALECINPSYCHSHLIDEQDGHLQHYRRDCENYPKAECDGFKHNTVKDLSLWKYKDELVRNVNQTLGDLKLH